MKKIRIVCVGLCLLLLLGCAVGCGGTANGKMTVSFLPVGKADAVLVKTPAGAALIDTGLAETAGTVKAALADAGVEELELLVLTCAGEEHKGGAAALLDAVSAKRIVAARGAGDGLSAEVPDKPLTVSVGEAVFTLFPAAKESYKKVNDGSLITELTYGETRMVFAADAARERIAEYLDGKPAPCDLLKLPDHGEWVPNTPDLIEALAPKNAVITCGEQSLPTSAATIDLALAKGNLFFTAYGEVIAETDGKTLTVTQPDNV